MVTRKIKSLMFIFFISWHLQANDNFYVYLGIVGPDQFEEVMGNAFLLFSKDKIQNSDQSAMREADIFQFALTKEEVNQNFNPLGFLGVGRRFILERHKGSAYILRYQIQDRPVVLFELNMTSNEKNNLNHLIDLEFQKRTVTAYYDFNLLKANVLAEILKLINLSVSEDKKLKTVWTDGANSTANEMLPGKLVATIPLLVLSELNHHPLALGRPILIPPYSKDELKISLKFYEQVSSLQKICFWSKKKSRLIQWLSTQNYIRENRDFLVKLKRDILRCQHKEANVLWNQYLGTLLYSLKEGDIEKQKMALDLMFDDQELEP